MPLFNSLHLRLRVFFFSLLVAACLFAGTAMAAPLRVAVTIAPQAWLVDQIGGDLVSVETLVPAGSDLHSYEPKPSQMAALTKTQLYLTLGVHFETAWLPRLTSANPAMHVLPMDRTIQRIAMASQQQEHGHAYTDGRSHGEYDDHEKELAEGRQWTERDGTPDPHIWTDPANMLIMAKNTFEALQQADKPHAESYLKNYFKVRKDMEKLERDLMKMFAARQGHSRAFLVFHPCWGYFARAHGLTQIPIEIQGKEPSPKELVSIIKQATAMHAKAIFVQPQRSRKAADVVAGEIGAKVIEADPLAYDWPTNLRTVASSFRQALQ